MNLTKPLALVVCLAGMTSPVLAADEGAAPGRPGDLRSAGGYFIAPRFLDHVGDSEFYLDGVYCPVSSPNKPGTTVLGQLGLEYKLTDCMDLHANLGPISLIGLRGELMSMGRGTLGYGLYYRTDSYPISGSGYAPGTGPTFYGLAIPGVAEARGAELRLESLHDFKPLMIYVSPVTAVLSNRSMVGADVGVDLDFDRMVVGYTASLKYNYFNPFPATAINSFEVQHSLGVRYVLSDHGFVHAHYMIFPADTYYNSVQVLVAGFGLRVRSGI